jgi:hypothetical protein
MGMDLDARRICAPASVSYNITRNIVNCMSTWNLQYYLQYYFSRKLQTQPRSVLQFSYELRTLVSTNARSNLSRRSNLRTTLNILGTERDSQDTHFHPRLQFHPLPSFGLRHDPPQDPQSHFHHAQSILAHRRSQKMSYKRNLQQAIKQKHFKSTCRPALWTVASLPKFRRPRCSECMNLRRFAQTHERRDLLTLSFTPKSNQKD